MTQGYVRKMTSYLVESLRGYKRKNKLPNWKIAESLGVHQNSISNWLTYKVEPSALAKAKIKEYLIKNL